MSEEKKQCDSKSCDKKSCEGCSHANGGGIPKEELNAFSEIKKVIGVVSGKGGVGKSFVTASLANEMAGIPCRYSGCRYHRAFHPQNVRDQRFCYRG